MPREWGIPKRVGQARQVTSRTTDKLALWTGSIRMLMRWRIYSLLSTRHCVLCLFMYAIGAGKVVLSMRVATRPRYEFRVISEGEKSVRKVAGSSACNHWLWL